MSGGTPAGRRRSITNWATASAAIALTTMAATTNPERGKTPATAAVTNSALTAESSR